MWNRAAAGVRHEADHTDRAGVYVDVVRLRKQDIACDNVELSGNGTAAENEKPGLSVRFQTPRGVWRQIDPFEYEVWVGNEKSPLHGKLVRLRLKFGRPGLRHRDGVFDVKFTLPPVIEQTECHVASLLDFRNDEACANRVNCPRGHENDVICRHRAPRDEIGDRAVVDGPTQLLRRQSPTKSEGNLGLGSST